MSSNNSLITVLLVAEKPSIAISIATALSNDSMKSRGKPLVHEFESSSFKGISALFKVTSVCGHVFSLDFHELTYNKMLL